MKGNTNDLFVFLFFSSLMRIVLPFNFREITLFVPFIIGIVLFIKNNHKLNSIKKAYLNTALIVLFAFFVFIFIQVFNDLQLPGFLGSQKGNSGFLTRWNLINSVVIFCALFIGFKIELLRYMIDKLNSFYGFVFVVSIFMLILHINSLPLFNTFSWSVIVENASSKKMIVAGSAAVMLLIYRISFKKISIATLAVLFVLLVGVLMAGARTAFLSYFLILFFGYMVYKRSLLQSILFLFLFSVFASALLLSHAILLIPEKYQRLFIIFPSEFYSNSLQTLQKSSAANSSNFRYEMWSKAFLEIKEHPIIGKGIGIPKAQYDLSAQGLSAFQKINSETLIEDFMTAGSLHNAFVSVAYTLGVPAAILFFMFLLICLLKTYKLSMIYTDEMKNVFVFFTLIILNFIIQAFVSDIHLSVEFYVMMAFILKSTLLIERYYPSPLTNTPIKVQ
ncbi:MAG: O-antigen ligase family protein [Sphingobacteriaceae bacterium]